jgi:hypothetical protein
MRSKELGRPRSEGKRRALTSKFIEALAADWEQHGEAALEQVRLEDPSRYCELVARLVPVQAQVEVENALPELEGLKTSEEVFQYIEAEIARMRAEPNPAGGL